MEMMKKKRWNFVALSLVLITAACGSEKKGGGGDGDGDVGDGDGDFGDGDGDGDSLDQGSLAANCAGVTPVEGESCGESGLVCRDERGDTCVCGGLTATGDDDDFGRPGRPREPSGGIWECFGIGQTASGGGAGDTGDGDSDEPSGGADGSGGASLGGQGGDGPT